ncbi:MULTISPECIES: hypothetical protein [unclassified Adlercreutzia]|uniref:hypothetical protein n=1 Tax=unclassified Adlercreutzia TaxID=2636013 RepID=UPI0013EB42ED|nr:MULTISPECIES: hypothetical protein [unclassified Adlercreutzia]
MNEGEFRRAYARIEENVRASDELKRRTRQALGLPDKPEAKNASTSARKMNAPRRRRIPTRKPNGGAIIPSSAWRTALAACLAIIAGVGLLFGACMPDRIGAALSGNSFSLIAYAEEPSRAGDDSAGIGLEKFYPSRTSAGYLYDATTDTVSRDVVAVSRCYVFDMTVAGRNVNTVEYSIEGEGVSYGSWKSSQGSEGTLAEESSNSFVIPFNDGEPVVREIRLDYVLDDEERGRFDSLYETDDADGMETLLATCDAKRLANVTVIATATFSDGTSRTKSYGLEPAEGFEGMYRACLSQLPDSAGAEAWTSLSGEPSLFNLVEKVR